MTRIIGAPHSPRRYLTFLVCLAAALSIGLLYIAVAQSSGNPQDSGLFQLDGNTLPGDCASPFPATTSTGGDDWAALYNHRATNPPCGSDGFAFVADGVGTVNPVDTTYWNGGGSKDAYDPPPFQ